MPATAAAPSVSSSAMLRPLPATRTRPSAQSVRGRQLGLTIADAHGHDVGADLGLELVGRAAHDDHAAVDDREPVAEPVGLLEVVRRQEQRDALALQPPQLVPERRARGRVDARRGLVEEQQARPVHEPAGEVDAPAHAARVRAHLAVGGLLEPEQRRAARRRASARLARESPYSRPIMSRCSRPVA